MPPNTVKVDRSTKWGNPFSQLTPEGNVELFRTWLTGSMLSAQNRRAEIEELRGKNLACWCGPDQPCHADVLLDLANGGGPRP